MFLARVLMERSSVFISCSACLILLPTASDLLPAYCCRIRSSSLARRFRLSHSFSHSSAMRRAVPLLNCFKEVYTVPSLMTIRNEAAVLLSAGDALLTPVLRSKAAFTALGSVWLSDMAAMRAALRTFSSLAGVISSPQPPANSGW